MAAPIDFTEPTLAPDTVAEAAAHPERALKVVDLYKSVIGARHQAYYLKQFARQEGGPGWRLSWHWPAFFSALNWFIFRKMWTWAGRYAALLAVLALAIWQGAGQAGLGRVETLAAVAVAWLGVSVLSGLLANALYYRHCMDLIHRVLVNGVDREAAADVLAEQASGNRRWSGQVLVNVALLLFLPALATFAPWSGRDLWDWLSETPTEQATPTVPAASSPASDVAESERRVWPPGTQTPTLKIISAEPEAPAQKAPTPSEPSPSVPADPPAPAAPVPPPAVQRTVSESQASALAGLVLPGTPPPAQPPVPASGKAQAKTDPKAPALQPASAKTVTGAESTPYGVQVGIFAQPANVANVLAQLKAQGMPVYTDPITLSGQPRTRVRVGPYAVREDAQRVAGQIADLGLPAVVVRVPAVSGR